MGASKAACLTKAAACGARARLPTSMLRGYSQAWTYNLHTEGHNLATQACTYSGHATAKVRTGGHRVAAQSTLCWPAASTKKSNVGAFAGSGRLRLAQGF